jgi:2',3'-cyclic-nucleotide 2'-phosphodiesterase (5'-nucleotidase family)
MRAGRVLPLAAVLALAASPLLAKPQEVYIAFTSNVTGLLTTCNSCSSVTVGGMSQKAAVLAGWRKNLPGPLLLLDAGNSTNFGAGPAQVQVMLKAMDRCGYAAANVGDNEVAFGAAVLEGADKGRKVRWISANLTDESGRRIFPASMVLDARGVKVGVVGILDPEAVEYGFPLGRGLKMTDPVKAASAEISRLRKECDVVVLLANAPPDRMDALARALPQADLVAGGSQNPQIAEPAVLGGTLVFQPGRYQVARVRMRLKQGKYAPSKWDAYTIPKSAPRDEEVEAMIQRALHLTP